VNVTVFVAGFTVCVTDPEAPVWFVSPANVAVTVSLPPPRLVVVHVAVAG
jgi:threonine/homoserine/homoserine lactone efflux protein